MSIEVPPIEIALLFASAIKIGSNAITLKRIAPRRVILERIFLINSAVGLPGRIPGIAPLLFLRLFAISTGLY